MINKIKMQKLNYYSRYNRIKSPRKIGTLYHLIQDLNLQAIVTDDLIERVTKLRDAHEQARLRLRQQRKQKSKKAHNNNNSNNSNQNNNQNQIKTPVQSMGSRGRMMLDQQEDRRRVASYEKSHTEDLITEELLQNKFLQQMNKKLKPITQRSKHSKRSNLESQSNNLSHKSNKNQSKQPSHHSNYNEEQFIETKSVIQYSQPLQEVKVKPQNINNQQSAQKIETNKQQYKSENVNKEKNEFHQQQIQKQTQKVNQKKQKKQQYKGEIGNVRENEQQKKKKQLSSDQIPQFGNQSRILQADAYTNKRDNQKQQLFKSNFDGISEGLAELKNVDERNSSFVKPRNEHEGGGKQISDMGCRSQKLYRLFGSDIQVQGTDRQDQISIDKSPNIEQKIKQAQVILPIKKTMTASPDSDAQKYHNQYEYQYEYEYEEQHGNENIVYNQQEFEGQEQNHQQKYMENRRQIRNMDNQSNRQKINFESQNIFGKNQRLEANRKIPSKGLSEGKWPEAPTQKSIEESAEVQISAIPSTFLQKQLSQNKVSEKQRKPFKKMMMDKKLHPRMVTSTIVNDPPPMKKVNFKKMIKKQSVENKKNINAELTPEKKRKMFIKPAEEKKNLLKAFFDLN